MFLNCFLIEDICLINSEQPEKTIKVSQKKLTKGQDAQYILPQGQMVNSRKCIHREKEKVKMREFSFHVLQRESSLCVCAHAGVNVCVPTCKHNSQREHPTTQTQSYNSPIQWFPFVFK